MVDMLISSNIMKPSLLFHTTASDHFSYLFIGSDAHYPRVQLLHGLLLVCRRAVRLGDDS